ncbi:hypothetical protein ALI22I_16205 [Saccharothrix sp. ALI-22-I]|uniref:hypothetical protein n=1 Tax=Saccharothrix sp. ALI-22-I TaxID=1933778 RepID=UPI00097C4B95|nr:hypothetical protein [Saccharothrix sp. ALI-22-I]ONI89065.1 hypothetical protein ALI22I_16205 [Saccharothrix sp. ALI-22-I]
MRRRLLGAALLVVAGVAAVVGTFLPLFWEGSDFGQTRLGFTTTSWEITTDSDELDVDLMLGQSPQFGVPIVVSAVLLAVAAALVFLPESQRLAARYTAIAGTGLLAGAVSATGSVVVSAVADVSATDLRSFTQEAGAGILVLGASVVVAVVGVVLLHARRAQPLPDGPVVYRVDDTGGDDDTDTPPFGIPVQGVEVAQIPQTEYERPSDASGSDR